MKGAEIGADEGRGASGREEEYSFVDRGGRAGRLLLRSGRRRRSGREQWRGAGARVEEEGGETPAGVKEEEGRRIEGRANGGNR